MNNNRVVVTGVSLLTGLGLSTEDSWNGIIDGKSSINRFSLFDTKDLSANFGVELPEGSDELFKKFIKKRKRGQMTRGTMISTAASLMAFEDSKLDKEALNLLKSGVVVGATGTGYAPEDTNIDEYRILKNMASSPAAWISLQLGFQGPSFVTSTACSSSTYAMHSAFMLIASGQCDVVLSGGGDSAINYPDVKGFESLMALSEEKENISTASRPFDKNRNGFVMGEGAGMLILESLDHAQKRGAEIYAEIQLPGLSSESHNIMSPKPDGSGMATTMNQALQNSGIRADEIGYINAHGTSTPLNDKTETSAIKSVFKDYAYKIPVSSTKGATGHCLSAAAGVEAVISCLSIRDQIIPPTANYSTPDPECDLDYVPNKSRKADIINVMSNSFAFGGHNGTVIFSKF